MEFKEKLKQLRTAKGFTLRGLAAAIDVAAPYLSDIEKGNRPAPSDDILKKMIIALSLSEDEIDDFIDSAASSKNCVANDISSYVQNNEFARVALRKAKELNLDKSDWFEIIKEIEKRKK